MAVPAVPRIPQMDLSTFKLFKQGAEACLYAGDFLGQSAVVKQRFSKKYRHPTLDLQLTKDRHKAEVRAILKCKSIGVHTPVLYLADNPTNTIVMENMEDSVTAKDFINNNLKLKNNQQLETICKEIGCVVAKLHSNGIIHGDITTSNILITTNNNNIVIIDFGLSFMEGTQEDKGVDLYVLERAFLSTHPNTEHLFDVLLGAYTTKLGKHSKEVITKFQEIRLRGRKRTMVG